MEVTKSDITEFLKSWKYELHRIEDVSLRNSLNELWDIVENFFLFGKPGSYVLKDWEYNACLRMSEDKTLKSRIGNRMYVGSRNVSIHDKYISLEPFFISFKRDQKINLL